MFPWIVRSFHYPRSYISRRSAPALSITWLQEKSIFIGQTHVRTAFFGAGQKGETEPSVYNNKWFPFSVLLASLKTRYTSLSRPPLSAGHEPTIHICGRERAVSVGVNALAKSQAPKTQLSAVISSVLGKHVALLWSLHRLLVPHLCA